MESVFVDTTTSCPENTREMYREEQLLAAICAVK